jgi:methylglyoxal/glyoxal reductase
MDIRTTKRLDNGVEIPVLGLGVFKAPDGRTTVDAVRWALEEGYRHIDTAAVYRNEESVGQGIRESGVPREEIFVTTKLWNDDMRAGTQREAFERSLSKLGTGYVDLYLIHWPAPGAFLPSWKVLEALYREGRVRAIGVSNFHEHHLEELMAVSDVRPVLDQVECHPRLSQVPLVDFCTRHGVAFETWSPLGGEGGDLMQDPALRAIGARHGKSIAQVVLRWNLQRGLVTIPKSVRRERIRENAAIFDFALSPEDMAAIDALNEDRRFGPSPESFPF